jgi:hypothetical protein
MTFADESRNILNAEAADSAFPERSHRRETADINGEWPKVRNGWNDREVLDGQDLKFRRDSCTGCVPIHEIKEGQGMDVSSFCRVSRGLGFVKGCMV